MNNNKSTNENKSINNNNNIIIQAYVFLPISAPETKTLFLKKNSNFDQKLILGRGNLTQIKDLKLSRNQIEISFNSNGKLVAKLVFYSFIFLFYFFKFIHKKIKKSWVQMYQQLQKRMNVQDNKNEKR